MLRPVVSALLLLLALAAAGPAQAADKANAAKDLHALFGAEWERGLRENPVMATYIGDHRFDDRWPDLSPAALQASYEGDKAVIAALDRVDPNQLTPADQLNRDLFRRQYQANIDTYDYGSQYTPLSQRSGLASMHRMADVVVFKSVKDYEQWLSRIGTLDTLVDQNIALMREGVQRGQVPPKIIMQRVPPQLDKQIVTDPLQSPFYEVFKDMPDSIPAAEQARLQAAARAAIMKTVVPSYTRLKQYIVDDYLPRARESVGLWDTPNGTERYAELARFYTTTNLTPDEIHEIGLKEVARIRGEMMKVIAQTGFKGSFDEFLTYLRTDPKFRYTDPQELLQAYEAMAKRVDPKLPQYFGKLPRMPYGVRPIAEQVAPDTTTAYYQGPAMDGKRAGYYYVNLYKPEERPKYEIPVLTIHEAVPGHHLQISLAQELGELPISAATSRQRRSSKAGRSTARASARKWASTPTRTTSSASSPTRCGAPCASSSTRGFTTSSGRGSRRSTTSRPTPPRPSSTSSTRSTATSATRARRSPTRSANSRSSSCAAKPRHSSVTGSTSARSTT